jgi:hypothetical protein
MWKPLIPILIAIVLGGVPSAVGHGMWYGLTSVETQHSTSTAQGQAIQVTIAAGGGLYGPVRDRFRVGERIPITITMTNKAKVPVQICLSDDFFQNRPELTRDGQQVPYGKLASHWILNDERARDCKDYSLPITLDLVPNKPMIVDWIVLCENSDDRLAPTFYEPLQAGKYQLTLRRSFECCYTQQAESNTISFEITQ